MKQVSRMLFAAMAALALTGSCIASADNVNKNPEWVMVYHSLIEQDKLVAEVIDKGTGEVLKASTFLVSIVDGGVVITPDVTLEQAIDGVEAGGTDSAVDPDPVVPDTSGDNAGTLDTSGGSGSGIVDGDVLEDEGAVEDETEDANTVVGDSGFMPWLEAKLTAVHQSLTDAKTKLSDILSTKVVVPTPVDSATPSAATDDAPSIEASVATGTDVPAENTEPNTVTVLTEPVVDQAK